MVLALVDGVAIVIAHDTGKVLDYEVMSKYCYSCQYWEKQPTSSEAFQVWKATHKCDVNFEGSRKQHTSVMSILKGLLQPWRVLVW